MQYCRSLTDFSSCRKMGSSYRALRVKPGNNPACSGRTDLCKEVALYLLLFSCGKCFTVLIYLLIMLARFTSILATII